MHCGSYAWAGAFRGNSPLRSTIANPAERGAPARGHRQPPRARATIQPVGSKADCLVGYGIGGNYVVDGGATPYGYGWGYGWGYGGWATAGAARTSTREGIIADRPVRRQERPADVARLRRSEPRAMRAAARPQKRIDEAVAAIFTKYPG